MWKRLVRTTINKIDNVLSSFKEEEIILSEEERAFLSAARDGDLNIIQQYIQNNIVNVETKPKHGNTALLNAAMYNRFEIVEYLIEHGDANVEATDSDGYTALHFACEEHFIKIAQYLIQYGNANVDTAVAHDGSTALHIAICCFEIVQCLVKQGNANVEARNNNGATPLFIACEEGAFEIVQFLLEHGNANVEASNNDGWTPLHNACYHGHEDIVQYLLQEGNANIEVPNNDGATPLLVTCGSEFSDCLNLSTVQYLLQEGKANVNASDKNGWTALHVSCQFGHFDIVKYLIQQANGNVTAKTKDGCTALYIASQEGHLEIVQYLKEECGAKINIQAKDGTTPLTAATKENKMDVVIYLESITTFLTAAESGDFNLIQQYIQNKKVIVEIKHDETGWTALHFACHNNHVKIVLYLLQHGNVNVNATTNDGSTALHNACNDGNYTIVLHLVQEGKADVEVANDNNLTPLHIACQMGHVKIAKILLVQGHANVNTTINDGSTALHIACQSGSLPIVRCLIEKCGAKINDKTKFGDTPLDIAKDNDRKDVVEYLESLFIENLSSKFVNKFKPNDQSITSTIQDENKKKIESDRNQLLKVVNDPTLEPFSVSLHYINECTSNFTSKLLGEGSYGKVYFGCDTVLGIQLAIKKLHVTDKKVFDKIKLSFQNEIKVLKKFRHPNIVMLYGFNADAGIDSQVLVYEYLSNGPLSAFLRDRPGRDQLTAKRRLSIMYQVARSINYLHKGGIDNKIVLHRDIKSDNICLTQNFTAKLIDCGLSKIVDSAIDGAKQGFTSQTMGFTSLGTHGYTCPSFYLSKQYDEKCDIFSVGIVLAELVVGCLQNSKSTRDGEKFGNYFARYIKNHDDKAVQDGWTILSKDADPTAHWNKQYMENLCKLVVQCIVASPSERILSNELTDRLSEISKINFNLGYVAPADNSHDHKMSSTIKGVQLTIDDTQSKIPCVFCHKFTSGEQSVNCNKGHKVCVQCVEQLVQDEIGQGGRGIIKCDVDRCNGLFDDNSLYAKISYYTYHRYITGRGNKNLEDGINKLINLNKESHDDIMTWKNLTANQKDIQDLKDMTLENREIMKQQHDDTIGRLAEMKSMMHDGIQRTLYALAYLATKKREECPTLIWLVPSERTAGKSWIKWAKSKVSKPYNVYFVCQHSYTVVDVEMEINVTRDWLKKIAPILKVSLILIKAAIAACGLPLPFPVGVVDRLTQIGINEEFVSDLMDDTTAKIIDKLDSVSSSNIDLTQNDSSELVRTTNIGYDALSVTLTGAGYDMIVEKATKPKRSQWTDKIRSVLYYNKLVWVKPEYVPLYTKLNMDP